MAQIIEATGYNFFIKIPNFTEDFGTIDESIDYCFNIGSNEAETNWKLKFYPKGTTLDQENLVFSLTLQNNRNPPLHLCWKIFIIDNSGRKRLIDCAGIVFDEKKIVVWNQIPLILRVDLFDPKKELLKNNTLTFSFKFSFEENDEISSDFCRKADKNALREIYKERKFTDVTLKFGSKSIRVHKTLLAACCSTFKKHFETLPTQSYFDYRDSGIEYEVAEKMIDFVYEEKIEDMEKYAKLLLETADKLGISHLKAYCKEYFHKTLNIKNAAETLKFSIDYHSVELNVLCHEFIQKKNLNAVVSDQSWKRFITEFPALFNDVFESFAKENNKILTKKYDTVQVNCPKVATSLEGKLARDFGYLYKDMVLSDVELEVDGRVLKAHKAVLMNGSTVFKAMFSHNTVEVAENRVVIKDFKFQTIQELLRYIYCEQVENLEAIALDLIAAADYYNLMNLKQICTKSLENQINMKTITEILDTSETHNCQELKQKAIAYLGRNILGVIETQEWDNFIQLKPLLINEIFSNWISICKK